MDIALHNHNACEKIFSAENIYCDSVLYVVRKKKKDNSLQYFQNLPTPEVLISTLSSDKIKLLFRDSLIYCFVGTITKWQIKGKLVFYKLG